MTPTDRRRLRKTAWVTANIALLWFGAWFWIREPSNKYRLGIGYRQAVGEDDVADVEKYFRAGVDPNGCAPVEKWTAPLEFGILDANWNAMHSGSPAMRLLFIRYGAEVDGAFHYAATIGDLPNLKLLYPHLKPAKRQQVLNRALVKSYSKPAITEYLLRQGADANARITSHYEGEKPSLRTAAMENALASNMMTAQEDAEKEAERLRCLKILLRHGANLNQKDSQGRTALALAKDQPSQNRTVIAWLKANGAR